MLRNPRHAPVRNDRDEGHNHSIADEPSTVFFPLRTSVELFVDPTSPAAVTRAKEAALLYERLIFETGLLEVTIGETGSSSFWIPSESLTPARLEASRMPVRIGAPFSLSIGVQPGPGQAPERMTTMISTPVKLAFRAEWQTGILDELATFEPDWVEVIETGGGEVPISDPLGQQIAEQNYRDWTDKPLLADCPTHQRDFTYKAFNRDSSMAAALGAAFSLTPLFDPMVRRRGVVPVASGDQALSILVPNIGACPGRPSLSSASTLAVTKRARSFVALSSVQPNRSRLTRWNTSDRSASKSRSHTPKHSKSSGLSLGKSSRSRPQKPPYRSCRPPGRSSKRRQASPSSCALIGAGAAPGPQRSCACGAKPSHPDRLLPPAISTSNPALDSALTHPAARERRSRRPLPPLLQAALSDAYRRIEGLRPHVHGARRQRSLPPHDVLTARGAVLDLDG